MSDAKTQEYFRISQIYFDQGDINAVLHYSGDELARVSNEIREATDDERKEELAVELLALTSIHTRAMAMVGFYTDAIATDMLSLILIIELDINPENIGSTYLGFIIESLDSCVAAGDAVAPELRPNFLLSTALLLTLARVTTAHFLKEKIVSGDMWKNILAGVRKEYNRIPNEVKKSLPQIQAYDAVDIFVAVVEAMHDAGADMSEE